MSRCNATIEFGDDHGDNSATFHCQLEEGHAGMHSEKGDMDPPAGEERYPMPYILTWSGDQREADEKYKMYWRELQSNCKHEDLYKGKYNDESCNVCGLTWINGEIVDWSQY